MAIIEILRNISDRDEGLAFFSDTEDISKSLSFAYSYVPTIIAVGVSILWSYTDLDIQRLEPYFQLSKPTGAPASVLFVDYDFEYPFAVPFVAVRRKHWTVVLVSTISLLASILLPALQSSLLALSQTRVSDEITLKHWSTLLDPVSQGERMSIEPLNRVYDIFSANASLPPFTTPDYAVSPIDLPYLDENATWSTNLTVYWAGPSCLGIPTLDLVPTLYIEPDMDYSHKPLRGHLQVSGNVNDLQVPDSSRPGYSCSLNYSYSGSVPINSSGSQESQSWHWEQVSPDKSMPTSCNQFNYFATLFTIAPIQNPWSDSSPPRDIEVSVSATLNAVVCAPKHFATTAQVEMLPNWSVLTVNLEKHPSPITNLTAFNILSFQGSLRNNASPGLLNSSLIGLNMSLPKSGSIGPRVMTYFPLTGEAYSSLSSVAQVGSPTNSTKEDFQDKISKAYKQIFAISIADMFDTDKNSETVRAVQTRPFIAITMNTFPAIFSEVLLGLIAFTSLVLAYLHWNYRSLLRSDPDSIGAICSLVADLMERNRHFNDITAIQEGLGQKSAWNLFQKTLTLTCQWRTDKAADKIRISPLKGELASSLLNLKHSSN